MKKGERKKERKEGTLTDKRCMENQAVLGRVMLRFEGTEERLLGTEDLDSRRGLLGEGDEGTSVGDEAGADEFTNKSGEVRRDGSHTVAEVLVELGTVLGDGDDLVGEEVDVVQVGVGDFGTHRDGGGGLEGLLKLLGEDVGEVGGVVVGAETWERVKRK
jgi:hypothetical protein